MRRHPICDDLHIPEPSADRIEEIAQQMRDNGWDRRHGAAWVYQKMVLVGATRLAAAKRAKVKPVVKTFKGTRAQAVDFCYESEVLRRQLTAEQEKRAREARIGKARAEGKSLRSIAEAEGVSKDTVAKVVAAKPSTPAAPGTPENVVGKDGKTYPAVQPAPRCAKCTRVFPNSNQSVKGCEGCARIKAEARAAKKGHTEPGTHEPKRGGTAKGGAAGFDWHGMRARWAALTRDVDALGRLYGQKESPEAQKLRTDLADWHTRLTAWGERISKTKAPAL